VLIVLIQNVIASKAKQSLRIIGIATPLWGLAMTLVLYSVIASKAKQSPSLK